MRKVKERCNWAKSNNTMMHYHDEVWGVPLYEDQKLFRKMILDINQAGLSWQTILNKEAGFDQAYDFFEIEKVATFDEKKVEELMNNSAIIRNRRKIEAAIHNAKKVIEIQNEYGSFSKYLWSFNQCQVMNNEYNDEREIPTTNDLSDAIAKDLKKKGFKFVGSTIIYAFLQATGMINDHVTSCFRHQEVMNLTKKKRTDCK
ncbi:DNA-3-methyladenine glycosylase I [Enterococcus rivorum]|nr:DNA-3-methyladenine glycosylase I [Enterococcus rivorum]